MSEQSPQPKRIDLNLVQVVDLGCRLMHQAFVRQPEDKAKAMFKDLKQGKALPMGAITLTSKDKEGVVQHQLELPLSLTLDHSEFKGPGFGFPPFKAALQAMLNQIGRTINAKQNLNLLTSEDGQTVAVHRPGIIRAGEQYNVLVLTILPNNKGGVGIQLMFVDPDQYEALRPEAVSVEG